MKKRRQTRLRFRMICSKPPMSTHLAQRAVLVRQHDQQQEVEKLKRELACAVLNENYERAARLRDLIAEFTPENITEQTE